MNHKTFKEVLRKHKKWDLLICIDDGKIRTWDDYDLYGDAFYNYVDDYHDTLVNYVEYCISGQVILIISFVHGRYIMTDM